MCVTRTPRSRRWYAVQLPHAPAPITTTWPTSPPLGFARLDIPATGVKAGVEAQPAARMAPVPMLAIRRKSRRSSPEVVVSSGVDGAALTSGFALFTVSDTRVVEVKLQNVGQAHRDGRSGSLSLCSRAKMPPFTAVRNRATCGGFAVTANFAATAIRRVVYDGSGSIHADRSRLNQV